MLTRMAMMTAFPLLSALAACGPVPVEQAERSCLRDARYAQSPRGSVAIGAGSGGGYGRVELELSDDFLSGRSPAEAYERCVVSRSGQMPTRRLEDQPGWAG